MSLTLSHPLTRQLLTAVSADRQNFVATAAVQAAAATVVTEADAVVVLVVSAAAAALAAVEAVAVEAAVFVAAAAVQTAVVAVSAVLAAAAAAAAGCLLPVVQLGAGTWVGRPRLWVRPATQPDVLRTYFTQNCKETKM